MKSETLNQRKKAEDLLKKKKAGAEFPDINKSVLIHELEVHQIELELQNKELIEARERAESASDKYIELYDFAPTCYFTLNREGKIAGLNLMASQLIGKERERLVKSSFGFFVSDDTRHLFNDFFEAVLQSNTRKMCEVTLIANNQTPKYIHLTGIVTEKGEHCLLTVVDITERKNAEDQIRKLLMEKEIILKEVHHRIKNNMNTIIGLFSLQVNMEKDKNIVDALNDAKSRVQCMMILYDKLYGAPDTQRISIKNYLTIMFSEILSNFPNYRKIKTDLHIDDFIIDAQKLVPISIIMNELITNMMKYAFNERENGTITLIITRAGKHVIVTIQDDGEGMPESISFENSTGFGMKLVSILTMQINGIIRIERGEGTKFILELDV